MLFYVICFYFLYNYPKYKKNASIPLARMNAFSLYVVFLFDFTWIHSLKFLCKVTTYFLYYKTKEQVYFQVFHLFALLFVRFDYLCVH